MTEEILAHIEITSREVEARLTSGKEFLFVEVRENWEYDTSRIEGATLIPWREMPSNLARLEDADDIVLLCHQGMRSIDAATWLRSQGVTGARSMAGGIDRWAMEVDPAVPR
jgi:rhodanese-related sulfurtransferase